MHNTGIIPKVRGAFKDKLNRHFRRCRVPLLRTHYLIVIGLLNGHSVRHMASVLRVHRSTIYRVAARFREQGELGLFDRREDNGCLKLDEAYLDALYWAVLKQPHSYGWRRPTWTRELLVKTMVRQTGVRRPRRHDEPSLASSGCPAWTPATGGALPVGGGRENTAFEHHSPAVGHFAGQRSRLVWRRGGHPFESQDRLGLDVAGLAKAGGDAGAKRETLLGRGVGCADGLVVLGGGQAKKQRFFVALLAKLVNRYPKARLIHLIVDNYRIIPARLRTVHCNHWVDALRTLFAALLSE